MHASLSRWWNEISIRTKVTAITVTLVMLGLFVAGLGTMTVLSTYLLLQVDTDLKNAATNTIKKQKINSQFKSKLRVDLGCSRSEPITDYRSIIYS